MKKSKKEIREKAALSQRVIAFLIDMIIVASISSLIAMPFSFMNNSKNVTKLHDETTQIINAYSEGKIDIETYLTRAMATNHDIAKQNGLINIIIIVLYIVYFVILPFYNKGQTIGKKILKISVENSDEEKELTMNNLIIRSLLVNSILLDIITITLALLANNQIYFYGVLAFEMIHMIVFFISIIMISNRADGKGVHDLFANTIVLKNEVMIKEEITCES